MSKHPIDRCAQRCWLEGLRQVVHRPPLHRVHCGADRTVRRHHDHGHPARAFDQDIARLPGESYVRDHEVEGFGAFPFGFRNACDIDDLVPVTREDAPDLRADDPLVLHQKDLHHR